MSTNLNQDRIDELFTQAIKLPPEERLPFLNSACDGDAEALARIQHLLAAHERAEQSTNFLAEPRDDERPFRNTLAHDPLIGQRIGPYEVKRWLGGGGFGHVYLGFRGDDYKQKVAIKVLRSDIQVDDRVLARFELERQLLADLQHEHIARLLYGGTLDTGRPYIVMEYVKGQPITEYCDDKKLSVPDRLAVFRQVCEAVAYAHRYSAIHRDIKPGNVFVTDEGMVKLLDFGIAKMVDPISQRRMVTISEGGMPLTPEYASPEQVRGEGVSTASDVYSLGVVLYELLTGRRPYEFHRRTPAEFERVICEAEPRNPSTVVLEPVRVRRDDGTDDIRSAETISEPRGTDPQKLNRILKGDLEQIVLMALRKEPHRRYQTVDALVEDIDCFSSGRMIVARPVGRLERSWRWCKRQPATAALLGLALLVAIVGPLVALQQSTLRRRADDLALTRKQALEDLSKKKDELQTQLVRNYIERGAAEAEAKRISRAVAYFAGAYAISRPDDPLRESARSLLAGWGSSLGRMLVHDAGLFDARFSPDGQTILTGSKDGTAVIWDVATGKPRVSLKHGLAIHVVGFSPDGRIVLTAGDGRNRLTPVDERTGLTPGDKFTARLWNAATGNPIGEPLRHSDRVWAVAFSPDGRVLVTGSRNGIARLWVVATGKQIGELMRHEGTVESVAFSTDGHTVLTESIGKTARLWDATTGQAIGEPMRHEGTVESVAFRPDGHTFLTLSYDKTNTAHLWDATTGQAIGEPMRHENTIGSVAFSPDGRTILTGSHDRTARLWDAATGQAIGEPMRHEDIVRSVAFSPDGHSVVIGSDDRTASVWNAATGKRIGEPLRHDSAVYTVAFTSVGRAVLTVSQGGTACLWDFVKGKPIDSPLQHDDAVVDVAVSPDGHTVLTRGRDSTVRLWGAAIEKPCEPMRHEDAVTVVAFSPDGRTLFTGSSDQTARAWDAATGKQIGKPLRHDSPVCEIAFSPDGKIILTGCQDDSIQLWDAATKKPIGPSKHRSVSGKSIAISPDRRTRVAPSGNDTARLWNLTTGKMIGEAMQHDDAVVAVAFSPDNHTVLTGSFDRSARIWDAVTGNPVSQPFRDDTRIAAVAFSPDGRSIVTGSWGGAARLWDIATEKPIGEPFRHDGTVGAVAFSPDGRWLLTGSHDCTARLWPVRQLPDDPALIRTWSATKTGMVMDDRGALRPLTQFERLNACDEFEKLRSKLPNPAMFRWMDGRTIPGVESYDAGRAAAEPAAGESSVKATYRADQARTNYFDTMSDPSIAIPTVELMKAKDTLEVGIVLCLAGKPLAAENVTRLAIKKDASIYYGHTSLGLTLLAQGKPDEARKVFQEILRNLKRDNDTYDLEKAASDQLTAAYFVDLIEEEAYVQAFVSDKKPACFPWFYIAQRREIEGTKDAAIAAYKRCVELGQGDDPLPLSVFAKWRLRKLSPQR